MMDEEMSIAESRSGDHEGWEADGWEGDGPEPELAEVEHEEEKPASRAEVYYVLEQKQLKERQDRLINKTADLFFVTPAEAGCLLRHYGWKSKKLEEEWWLNRDKVRLEVGITKVDEKKRVSPDEIQCLSAYCERVPRAEATALSCDHWFCNECWTGFLQSEIGSGRKCVFTRCPAVRCKIDHVHKFGCACHELVPQEMFHRFVVDKAALAKYDKWLLNSFVEGQHNIKWCPRPGCERAIEFPSGGMRDIHCKCGNQFCFSCLEEAHCPAPCDIVKKWLLKEKSDDATQIWLQARTKECPKCKVRIEKNKACNHMTCAKCGHHFCWLCKGPWDKHGTSTGGFYVCSVYDQEMAKGKRSDEEKKMIDSTKLIQKYTWYYKRFKSSRDGITFTRKLHQDLQRELKDADPAEHLYVGEAIDRLVEARSVLEWCYVMSYYMRAGAEKELFEYQQQLLCGKTENLQDIIEGIPFKELHLKLREKRQGIQDLSASISKFRSEIIKLVEQGHCDAALQSEADGEMAHWSCSTCKADNKKEAAFCIMCTACRLHGEMDCKACKMKR